MREAAYMAGIGSPDKPAQVLIALEPEVASINCRKLKMNQVWPLVASILVPYQNISLSTQARWSSKCVQIRAWGGRGGVEDVRAHGLSGENILARERIVNLALMKFSRTMRIENNPKWKADGQLRVLHACIRP